MPIPAETVNEIKYRNDIESVISPYVELKRRGKNLVGLCPFHNEKTPSFTVYPENGSFFCFGCGVGGDVFTFIKNIENLDYVDAIRFLAEKSGIVIAENDYDNSMEKLKNSVYEINKETARFFHSYLMSPEGKWALDYFTGRGLTLSTIKHFGLGAAPDSWDALLKYLRSKGFSEADILAANVIAKSPRGTYYDRFRKRVIFPIINIRGRVVAFSGRAMPGEDKQGGKYVNTSDTVVYKKGENLFAMNFAKNYCDERIILVEGNMDVVSLHQAGFQNTVAALGTAFTPEEAKLLSRYTKEIVLTLDADAAGQKAVKRAGEILKNTGLNVRVIVIPDGKDPDEFIKKNGADRFKALLEGAVSEIEYKLLTAVEGIDIESDNGRISYLNKAAAIIAETNDTIARDLYIGKLSEKYGIMRSTLQTRVDELREKNAKRTEKEEFRQIVRQSYDRKQPIPEKAIYPAAVSAEETVIAVLLKHPDFWEHAFKSLSEDDFVSAFGKTVFGVINDCANSSAELSLSLFGEVLTDSQMGYLVKLLNGDKGLKNSLVVLNDCISVLKQEKLKRLNTDAENMSLEDWAENLKKIAENKNKGEK